MKKHVLVVDDDPGIRELVKLVLVSEGIPVETAANGKDAIDSISRNPPALVLLDLQMPIMNGWEAFTWLREANVRVPVVFMTAGYRAQTEAERYHADGYMPKPFDLSELLDMVDRFGVTIGGERAGSA